MKGKHSTPAFFFLYHPDRDSREFAALARKEGYGRILLLRRENPFVANLHPIQAESERSIWAVYLMDFRRPATHSSDAWNCEEAAKTLDCNIRIELSLPANATVSAVCQALKYCYSTRSVSDARIRAADCRGRTAKDIRASRHIRNLFPDVEVIQKMRLSRQRTEQIVVDYLFENTDFR